MGVGRRANLHFGVPFALHFLAFKRGAALEKKQKGGYKGCGLNSAAHEKGPCQKQASKGLGARSWAG